LNYLFALLLLQQVFGFLFLPFNPITSKSRKTHAVAKVLLNHSPALINFIRLYFKDFIILLGKNQEKIAAILINI